MTLIPVFSSSRLSHPLAMAFLGLAAFSLFLPLSMENHHFFGDDWAVLAYPSGFGTFEAILQFGLNHHRPGEGVYWILQHKLFGFDRAVVHVFSLMLNAVGSTLFGVALTWAFPRYPALPATAAVVAYFLPLLTISTFIMYTDNSRLSLMLFWASVVLFQFWAEQPQRIRRLVLAAAICYGSTVTYEAAVMLVAAIPLFVLPVLARKPAAVAMTDLRPNLIRFAGALGAVMALFLATRYLLFGGGVHSISTPFSWPLKIGPYLVALAEFLVFPFADLEWRFSDWAAGAAVAALAAAVMLALPAKARVEPGGGARRLSAVLESRRYIVLTATATVLLGMFPFMLIYQAPFVGTAIGSRFFSGSVFGIAMVLALPVTWTQRTAGVFFGVVLAAFTGINAAFLMDLSHKWEEAADRHCILWRNFLSRVPAVADGSTFLFIDIEQRHDGVYVFVGTAGLRYFVSLLYGRDTWQDYDTVAAYKVQRQNPSRPVVSERRVKVSRDGVLAFGRNPGRPFDADKLILMERRGDDFAVLDRIAKHEERFAIDWLDGIDELRTNRSLILPADPDAPGIDERLERLSILCP